MSLQTDLTGKVAIVTGGGRGIGQAIAYELSRNGAKVVVAARTRRQIEEAAKSINQAGGSAIALPCDIAREDQLKKLFDFITREFGKLDILINNAAVGRFGSFASFSTDQLDELININIRGTYICCREALKIMMPKREGYIINISSVVGFKGYENQSAYTATKHAVVGMTKVLAVEAKAYNIRVSLIHPGGVDTDLVGAARPDLDRSILLKPADIAQAVIYLLSLSEQAAIDEIYIRRRGSSPF